MRVGRYIMREKDTCLGFKEEASAWREEIEGESA
jgi:hypothetical protein